MKKPGLLAVCLISASISFAQGNYQQLIDEGIALHDKGDYEGALKKYEEVLAADKNNYLANYEKSFTYFAMQKYPESIELCKFLLKLDPANPNTKSVYINYGSALDNSGDQKQAIKIFDEGIKAFPDFYLLYYNKGLTLSKMEKKEDALKVFETGVQYNPMHASSHFAISFMVQDNKIAALLPTLVFLVIEPDGDRAKMNVKRMESFLNSNVQKKDDKNITISLSSDLLDTKHKKVDNDFHMTEMIVSLSSALDFDDKYKNETPIDRLKRKLEVVVSSLREGQKEGRGFIWKYYTPFFDELEKRKYLEAYCHIAYTSSADQANNQWLQDNKSQADELYQWLKEYKWPKL